MYKISDDNDDKFAREFRNFGDQNCVNSTRKLYLNKWHFENSLIFSLGSYGICDVRTFYYSQTNKR